MALCIYALPSLLASLLLSLTPILLHFLFLTLPYPPIPTPLLSLCRSVYLVFPSLSPSSIAYLAPTLHLSIPTHPSPPGPRLPLSLPVPLPLACSLVPSSSSPLSPCFPFPSLPLPLVSPVPLPSSCPSLSPCPLPLVFPSPSPPSPPPEMDDSGRGNSARVAIWAHDDAIRRIPGFYAVPVNRKVFRAYSYIILYPFFPSPFLSSLPSSSFLPILFPVSPPSFPPLILFLLFPSFRVSLPLFLPPHFIHPFPPFSSSHPSHSLSPFSSLLPSSLPLPHLSSLPFLPHSLSSLPSLPPPPLSLPFVPPFPLFTTFRPSLSYLIPFPLSLPSLLSLPPLQIPFTVPRRGARVAHRPVRSALPSVPRRPPFFVMGRRNGISWPSNAATLYIVCVCGVGGRGTNRGRGRGESNHPSAYHIKEDTSRGGIDADKLAFF
ncbi:hypothetical protein C7M84_003294 [Penaeus vannamei]|uniref:Uncharacterized protein n=1 Tax=Penaeus vannamei TaxID=6689 RepID=A0A423TNI7_PENVA|nr:hypothetical protein C7M84_003294 [Penaeus vannamei]